MNATSILKKVLGALPLTAELDWVLFHKDGKLDSRFRLGVLESKMSTLLEDIVPYGNLPVTGRKIFLFASWHYWIVHTAMCGLVLRGLGYDVTLGYMPYGYYDKPVNRFDLRLQDLYARNILQSYKCYLKPLSFQGLKPATLIPDTLSKAVNQATVFDT